MNELLHLDQLENAEKLADMVAVKLEKVLGDPLLSAEASFYGSKLSEISR